MTVSAVYPNGIVPWTNRVDRVNTVFAADPNQLAAEIIALESTIGTNPQIESAPPVGSRVVYGSASARLHDVQMGNLLPVSNLANSSWTVRNDGASHQNSYGSSYDPFGYFNGTDLTCKANGWYSVVAYQQYNWAQSGWVETQMWLAGVVVTADHWSWDFPENGPGGSWGKETKILSMHWEGPVYTGQRISIRSTNSSNVANVGVLNGYLRMRYCRAMPAQG